MAITKKLKISERAHAVIEHSIQGLIVISIINFTIQTLPNLSASTIQILDFIELVSVLVFSLEYLLRILFSPRPIRFIFSFFGLIDLIAILPFYLSFGADLRSLRAVRLFRLLRLLKFLRYGDTLQNLKDAFKNVKKELILFSFATLLLIYFSSVGIYYFENEAQPEAFSSIFSAMWWSVATLTTVGYGDIYPITAGGKIFSTFVVFIGLGLVAIPTGLVASSLTQALKKE
ncbi:ion transporter [Flavobacteriaceae bacterium]|jgi:voltage-gated potassium channel|nr:ion transporter [Flavobacteriaceae bacterium]